MTKEDLLRSIQEKMGDDFVSLRDLERPTSEFMMNYFIRFLNEYGVDIKEMNEESLHFHQESFQDSILYVQVYNAIRQVYPIPEFLKNFSIMSLIEPKVEDVSFVELMDNLHNFILEFMEDCLQPNKEHWVEKTTYLEKRCLLKETLKRERNDDAAMCGKLEPATLKVKEKCTTLGAEVLALFETRKVLASQRQSLETMFETKGHLVNELKSEKDIRTRFEVAQNEFATQQSKLETLEDKLRETTSLLHKKSAIIAVLEEALQEEKNYFVTLTSVAEHGEHLLSEENILKQLDRQKVIVEDQIKNYNWQIEATQTNAVALDAVLSELERKHATRNEAKNNEQMKTDLKRKKEQVDEDLSLIDLLRLTRDKNSKLFSNSIAENDNGYLENYGRLERQYYAVHDQIDKWLNEKIRQTK